MDLELDVGTYNNRDGDHTRVYEFRKGTVKIIDAREFKDDSHTLVHRILKKMRECEKYDIDYDSYIPRRDLLDIIEILDCCLKHKDSKYIDRRK